MKTSENGIKLIQEFEGCVLHPYLDSIGIPTIGYGNTYYENGVYVTMNDPAISQEQANSLFTLLLPKYESPINEYCKEIDVTLNQNNFDALVSAKYNLGNVKAQLDSFKAGTLTQTEWCAYCHAGGVFSQGLYNRRLKEWNLFITPVEIIIPGTNVVVTPTTYTPTQIQMVENSPVATQDSFWKRVLAIIFQK